jgi:hypothetical protein
MNVYTLTPLTRSVNQHRRVVIQGFDLPVRGLTIAGFALIPGIVATVVLWTFLGTYALMSILVIQALAFWFIESRSRSGLQLRRYQRFVDVRRSVSGTFLLCSRPIEPLRHQFGYVVASSVPSGAGRVRDLAILSTDTRTRRMVKSNAAKKGSR